MTSPYFKPLFNFLDVDHTKKFYTLAYSIQSMLYISFHSILVILIFPVQYH